jgi:small subunit ribosomal protein S2
VIPSNDDAIRAIKLLVGKIADAVQEGKAMRKDDDQMEEPSVEQAAPIPASARPRMDNEAELQDKDLLGEATLAKLAPVKPVEADIADAINEEDVPEA